MVKLQFKNLYFEVTHSCNQHCLHCFLDSSPQIDIYEMDTEKCLKVISNYKEPGGQSIFFTGGEPFVRKDILELLIHADGLGLKFSVSSNGILLSDNLIKKISKLKNFQYFFTSILAPDEESHNQMTQNRLSYKRLIKNLHVFNDIDQYVYIQSTLPRTRFDQMDNIMKTILSIHNNVTVKFTPIAHIGVKNVAESNNLIVFPEHFHEFIEIFDKIKEKFGDKVDYPNLSTWDNINDFHQKLKDTHLYGYDSSCLVVKPNGDMTLEITNCKNWTFGKAYKSCEIDINDHLYSFINAMRKMNDEMLHKFKGHRFIDPESYMEKELPQIYNNYIQTINR